MPELITVLIVIFSCCILEFLLSLRWVKPDPPHKGIRTFLGEREPVLVDEGLNLLLFPLFGHIPVKVEQIVMNLEEQEDLRPPDGSDLVCSASLTLVPAWQVMENGQPRKTAELLIKFKNAGGAEGVQAQLKVILQERLRQWVRSPREGPQNWEEAVAAQEDAAAVLLKAILGDQLTPIPAPFPTTVLLHYFLEPRPVPTTAEVTSFGKNWETIDEYFKGKDEERKKVAEAVRDRRKEIREAREGNGSLIHRHLGVAICRLNITKIKVVGKLADAAELRATEEQERKAEVYEVGTEIEKARLLVEAVEAKGEKLSTQQAYQVIMEWKTTREGKGYTIPGLSPVIEAALRAIFPTTSKIVSSK
ncbi:MAG: hypothetical protein V1696_00350 [Candidatus Jorgensenbacteria bacterium]